MMGIIEWVCDVCHNLMNCEKVGKNRWEVSCPHCGETSYVDDESEYINE